MGGGGGGVKKETKVILKSVLCSSQSISNSATTTRKDHSLHQEHIMCKGLQKAFRSILECDDKLNYSNYLSDPSSVLFEIYNTDFNEWDLNEETQNTEDKTYLIKGRAKNILR